MNPHLPDKYSDRESPDEPLASAAISSSPAYSYEARNFRDEPLSAHLEKIIDKIRSTAVHAGGTPKALVLLTDACTPRELGVRRHLMLEGFTVVSAGLEMKEDRELGWNNQRELLKFAKGSTDRYDLIYAPFPTDGKSHSEVLYAQSYLDSLPPRSAPPEHRDIFHELAPSLFNRLTVGGTLILDGCVLDNEKFTYMDIHPLEAAGYEMTVHPYDNDADLVFLSHPAIPTWYSEDFSMAPYPEYTPSVQFKKVLELPNLDKDLSEFERDRYVRVEEELKILHQFGPLLPFVLEMGKHLAYSAGGIGSLRPENLKRNTDYAYQRLFLNAAVQYANLMDYVELYRDLSRTGALDAEQVKSVLDIGCGSLYYGEILKNAFRNLEVVCGVESDPIKHDYFSRFWQPLLGLSTDRLKLHKGNAFSLDSVTGLGEGTFDLVLMQKWEDRQYSSASQYKELFKSIGQRLNGSGSLVITVKDEDRRSLSGLFGALEPLNLNPVRNWQASADYGRLQTSELLSYVLSKEQLAGH